MSDTLDQIRQLILDGKIRISDHGYDELATDGILAREAVEGLADAVLVEDYPEYPKGPCVLLERSTAEDNTFTFYGAFQRAKPSRPSS